MCRSTSMYTIKLENRSRTCMVYPCSIVSFKSRREWEKLTYTSVLVAWNWYWCVRENLCATIKRLPLLLAFFVFFSLVNCFRLFESCAVCKRWWCDIWRVMQCGDWNGEIMEMICEQFPVSKVFFFCKEAILNLYQFLGSRLWINIWIKNFVNVSV